jgi:hypothetical protein
VSEIAFERGLIVPQKQHLLSFFHEVLRGSRPVLAAAFPGVPVIVLLTFLD